MYADEKSDKAVVPMKQLNNEDLSLAEIVEGRALPKRNAGQSTAVRTQSRGTASSELAGVRQAVHCYPLTFVLEGGAQCVSSACWDLCGGYRATGIPTATCRFV